MFIVLTMIAIISENIVAEDRNQEYLDIVADLLPELEKIEGFISVERFQSAANPQKVLSLSFWKDEEFFIGFLNDYPDYETQGYSKEELLENLKSLLKDIESEEIPFIRKVEEFAVA